MNSEDKFIRGCKNILNTGVKIGRAEPLTISCGGCKHWDQIPPLQDDLLLVRKCKKMPMFWNSTDWDDDSNRVLLPEYKDQLAFCQDGSDYSASLLTRAEFFCAHHEPK